MKITEETLRTTFPDHSTEEIEGILEEFMGIETLVTMETLPYDGIHHIDMHMKLLMKALFSLRSIRRSSRWTQINANLDYVLSNYTTSVALHLM